MKKKYLFTLLLAGLGLTLASCGATSGIQLDYDDSDLEIDTPWTEYSLPVTAVNFAEGEKSITLKIDGSEAETHTYQYSVEPAKASKTSLLWSSADESIATVDKGVVTAVGGGQTTINVYNEVGSFTPITLDVKVDVLVKDINIVEAAFDADFNHSYPLSVTYSPAETTQKGVSWTTSDATIATVDDNGVVTTLQKTGKVTISATSAYINKVASVEIDVADRTVYPESVVIDACEEKVEIGHSFTFKAHAENSSGNPVTHPEMTYYSTNPDVLFVDEDSGEAHALAAGNAQVYAKSSKVGVESSKVTVEVFEVKVASIQLQDIVLSNRNGMSDIQVEFSYTTDTAGYETASIPNFTYKVGNTNIATVNDNGKLFAVNVGTTTITVTDLRSEKTATASLEVKYEVDTVNVNGTSSILIGGTTQLSVSTNPSGVPSEYVSFSSSDDNVATVSSSGLVTGTGVGVAVITATVLGKTGTINVTVEEPPVPFVEGSFYVVGNKNYASGTSSESATGSWSEAKQAFKFVDKVQEPHDTLLYEYRAIINFAKDDAWKIRGASYYLEPDGWRDGVTHQIGEYKVSEGAFAGDDPDMYVDENRNVVVARAGTYAIYYAQYTNENAEGWYSVYVGRHELTLSNTSPKLQINTSVVLEAHNWAGELSYNVTAGNELINVTRGTGTDDYKFTVAAGATAGTAKIVFTDAVNTVTVNVTITETPVSFKATINLDKSYFSGWNPAVSEFSIYLWDDDGNKPLGEWNDCKGNLDSGSVTVEHDRTINHFIFFFTQDGKTKQTIDLTCSIDDEYGYYTISLSQMSWKEDTDGTWKMNGVLIYGGLPPVPEEYYYKFYVKGIGGDWTAQEQYLLQQDSENINHLYLNHVALTALDEIKVYLDTDDPFYMNENDRWFGVASNGDHYTAKADGNLIVSETGTYTIDFYEEANNGNHIQLYDESTPPAPTYTYNYYVTGIEGWVMQAKYKMTVDPNNDNHYVFENIALAENTEILVYRDTDDPAFEDDHWLGVKSTYSDAYSQGTSDGSLKVTVAGTYNINLYVESEYGNHVILTPVSTPTPEEFDLTKTTAITVFDETGKGFTSYGVDIKLHLFDITFAEGSPITTVAGLKEADVTFGAAVAYNTENSVIDVTMTWVQNDPVKYTVTLPAYIQSCKVCVYNTNNAYVHEVHVDQEGYPIDDESYQFSIVREGEYSLYLFNNQDPSYNAWLSGDKFNTPLSLISILPE